MIGAVNRLGVEVRRGLSQFAVGSKEPALGFDFVGNDYVANGTKNLSQAVTHSRSGNATMTDGYGPELVTNGTFDTDTSDWGSTSATLTVANDRLLVTNTASNGSGHQTFNTTVGKAYICSYKAVEGTGTTLVQVRDINDSGTTITSSSNTTDQLVFIAQSATTAVKLVSLGSTGATVSYDNISVREMPVIKWGPHNLLTYSEDLTGADWLAVNSSVTSNVFTADSTNTAHYFYQNSTATVGASHTVKAKVKAFDDARYLQIAFGSGDVSGNPYANFDLISGTVTADTTTAADIVDLGDGYYEVSTTITPDVATGFGILFTAVETSTEIRLGAWDTAGLDVSYEVTNVHLYRSDLGGMVDNPERGDSYVPTTSAAKYLPRVGHHVYNGYEWVNEGMLHESESRTNVLTYSEELDGTGGYWGQTNVGSRAQDATGPDGTTSAVTLTDSGATGTGTVQLFVAETVSTSTVYTFSAFLKADQLDWAMLRCSSFTTPADGGVFFDLSTGTIGTENTGYTGLIEPIGNGWYRCSITFTTDASDTSGTVAIRLADADNDTTVDLDGTSSILVYGAQLEQAPTPSSYIPTSGSTVTRAADSLVIPSSNLPWPTPQYIGPELVTNGTFDTDVSGWSETRGNGVLSWDSGAAKVVASGAPDVSVSRSVAVTSGSVYLVSADITNTSMGSSAQLRFSTSSLLSDGQVGSSVVSGNSTFVSGYVVSPSSTMYVGLFGASDASGNTASIDNVSVREINPLSVSIQMDGRMTYADNNIAGSSLTGEAVFASWFIDASNYVGLYLDTSAGGSGGIRFIQRESGVIDVLTLADVYSPGVLVPYSIASRHGSTFINGAVDGTALTANTTPTVLPDLSATDLDLGYTYMGTINQFRVWSQDLGDTGIVDATEPSLEPSLSLTFDSTDSSFIVRDFT